MVRLTTILRGKRSGPGSSRQQLVIRRPGQRRSRSRLPGSWMKAPLPALAPPELRGGSLTLVEPITAASARRHGRCWFAHLCLSWLLCPGSRSGSDNRFGSDKVVIPRFPPVRLRISRSLRRQDLRKRRGTYFDHRSIVSLRGDFQSGQRVCRSSTTSVEGPFS